jgi:predicted transcriptional regulator of viral defense system
MLATNFISDMAARGRYTFTVEEASKALGQSLVATRAALRRLGKKGEIAMPYRGFWVIVPPEYKTIGCLPPDQFIPQLMEHLGESYYAGLLSAAEYHGAAHHRPQVFQVVVAKNRPHIECGKVRIRFVARKNVADIPTVPFKTPRGLLKLSTPEATAFDLVGYPDRSAGLDNVATILTELAEKIDADKLVEVARLSPIAWVQRLGYLFDLVGANDKTAALARYVEQECPVPTPLARSIPFKGATKELRWMVMVNAVVEAEV